MTQTQVTPEEVEAVRAACNEADLPLTCSYPECQCRLAPKAVLAILAAAQSRAPAEREIVERCAAVAASWGHPSVAIAIRALASPAPKDGKT